MEEVVISTNQGEPLAGDDTQAGQAFFNVCRRILGEEVPLLEFEQTTGFLSKISGLFHRGRIAEAYEKIQFHAQGSILQCCKRQTVNRASGRQTELYTGDGGTDETGDFIRYGKISGN